MRWLQVEMWTGGVRERQRSVQGVSGKRNSDTRGHREMVRRKQEETQVEREKEVGRDRKKEMIRQLQKLDGR